MSAASGQVPRLSAAGSVAVLILSLWVLAVTVPAVAYLWDPPGTLGLDLDYNNVVRHAGPVAAAADIAPGDRIDIRPLPLAERYAVPFGRYPKPGQRVMVNVVREGHERQVALIAQPVRFTLPQAVTLILRCLASLLIVAVGATVLVVRPSSMTWALFFYCLSPIVMGDGQQVWSFLPAAPYLALELAGDLLIGASIAGVLGFALRFPRNDPQGWRRIALRFVLPVWIALSAIAVYMDVAVKLLAAPAEAVQRLAYVLIAATYATAIWALASTYYAAPATDRQRIKWVIVAVCVGRISMLIYLILLSSSLLPGSPPDWALQLLYLCTAAGPFAVAYAVMRHHVIDVHFFISRAAILGALTGILLAFFTGIDWLFGRQLFESRVGVQIDLLAAVAFGLSLKRLEKAVEGLLERVFFRARYRAEARLELAAAELPRGKTQKEVDDLLVKEPAEAMALASAALFCRDATGGFVRDAAVGWEDRQATAVKGDDRLIFLLNARQAPIRLAPFELDRSDFPSGAAAPVLALPIHLRRDLYAFGLYGGHLSGANLDPEEVRIISHLVPAATAAYAHIEADVLRQEVEALRARTAQLQGRLAEMEALQDARVSPAGEAPL